MIVINSMFISMLPWISISIGFAIAGFAYLKYLSLLNQVCGNSKSVEIAEIIEENAIIYLKRQYYYIAITIFFVIVKCYFLFGFDLSLGVLLGALFSALCGIGGMFVSVKANVRVANSQNLNFAFMSAYNGGSIVGLIVIAFTLISVGIANMYVSKMMDILTGMSLGSSIVSVFARLGGGIFTKAADIGADLVGKVEAGIPEDDPRNPAVIADNVGDIVGDCAGTAADVFETYIVGFTAASYIVSSSACQCSKIYLSYPLIVSLILSVSSCVGVLFVRKLYTFDEDDRKNVTSTLLLPMLISSAIALIALGLSSYAFEYSFRVWFAAALGFWYSFRIMLDTYMYTSSDSGTLLKRSYYMFWSIYAVGVLMFWIICCKGRVEITESLILSLFGLFGILYDLYMCKSNDFVKSIAKSSETGDAMTVLQGVIVSMIACRSSLAWVAIVLLMSHSLGGMLCVAATIISMLGLVGSIMTLDAFGPIADNAGGIAEMAELGSDTRKCTDVLDSVGNTTKAVTKGYAVTSTALVACIISYAYAQDISFAIGRNIVMELHNLFVVIGLFLGASVICEYISVAIFAVRETGELVVNEIRDQFSKNPGILENNERPNYDSVITLLTEKSIKSMMEALVGLLVLMLISSLIPFIFDVDKAFLFVGGVSVGATLIGVVMAIHMTISGGAWDNAKKYIEEGNYGGKGSFAHKASVTGDTIGDPYKDTAGPALNPMIKLINIFALLFVMLSKSF